MAVLKYSKQREAIRDFLAHSEEHPTADMVYMNLRESFPNITPHDHFVCERCHCVEDIFLDDNEEITIAAQKKFDGKIRSHTTTFYGICKKCLA